MPKKATNTAQHTKTNKQTKAINKGHEDRTKEQQQKRVEAKHKKKQKA